MKNTTSHLKRTFDNVSGKCLTIELKNFKPARSLSEETNAFTADVWFNSKKAATVSNQGQGGDSFVRPLSRELQEMVAEAEAYCLKLPPIDGFSTPLPMSLDFAIDIMVEDELKRLDEENANKKLRTLCQTKILFRMPDDSEDGYRSYNVKLTPATRAALLKRFPGCTIINDQLTA